MTTYTLTGTINDVVSNPLVSPSRARAYLIPYDTFIVEGSEVRVGAVELALDATTGAFTRAGIPSGGYRVELRYYDPSAKKMLAVTTAFFNLSADADLSTKVNAGAYTPSLSAFTIGTVTTGTAAVTQSPLGTLNFVIPVSGAINALPSTIQNKTSAYTAGAGDFVNADTTSAGFTVTLPAAPATAALVAIKKTSSDTNTLTIAPSGGGTIDGDATATTVTKNAGVIVEHVGSNVWKVAASMSTTGPAGTNGTNGTNGILSTIEDEGTPLTQRSNMNFVGAGVTVTDAGSKTVVTIPGGSAPAPITAPTSLYSARTLVNAGSMTVTLTAGAAVGNTVVGLYAGGSVTVTSVTDSKGNTYTVDHTFAGVQGTISAFSARVTTALATSDTITLNFSAGGNLNRDVAIFGVGGITASSRFDTYAEGDSGVANNLTLSRTPALAQANEIAFYFAYTNGSGATFTPDDDWAPSPAGSISGASMAMWRATGNITPLVGRVTNSGNPSWSGMVVTYKGN